MNIVADWAWGKLWANPNDALEEEHACWWQRVVVHENPNTVCRTQETSVATRRETSRLGDDSPGYNWAETGPTSWNRGASNVVRCVEINLVSDWNMLAATCRFKARTWRNWWCRCGKDMGCNIKLGWKALNKLSGSPITWRKKIGIGGMNWAVGPMPNTSIIGTFGKMDCI